jgi:hypothetical protein
MTQLIPTAKSRDVGKKTSLGQPDQIQSALTVLQEILGQEPLTWIYWSGLPLARGRQIDRSLLKVRR